MLGTPIEFPDYFKNLINAEEKYSPFDFIQMIKEVGHVNFKEKLPEEDPEKEGYSFKIFVAYYKDSQINIAICRYFFKTKWPRVFDKDGSYLGSLEPCGFNLKDFFWKEVE